MSILDFFRSGPTDVQKAQQTADNAMNAATAAATAAADAKTTADAAKSAVDGAVAAAADAKQTAESFKAQMDAIQQTVNEKTNPIVFDDAIANWLTQNPNAGTILAAAIDKAIGTK